MVCLQATSPLLLLNSVSSSLNFLYEKNKGDKILPRKFPREMSKHESKEQRKCSANRSNKDYSSAYTLRFLPGHLQVIRFLNIEHKK